MNKNTRRKLIVELLETRLPFASDLGIEVSPWNHASNHPSPSVIPPRIVTLEDGPSHARTSVQASLMNVGTEGTIELDSRNSDQRNQLALNSFLVNAGGPYRVAEDSVLIVRGAVEGRSASSVAFSWDLDGDGVFGETGSPAIQGDEIGMSPTMRIPAVDADSDSSIRLRVTDANGLVAEAIASVHVYNRRITDVPVPDDAGEIRVTDNLFNNARLSWETTWVAANDAGRKVVAWDPYLNGAHTSWMGIGGKVYNANNQAIAGEFAVQQHLGGDNTARPHVDIAQDGSAVFVWQTWGGDGQGWGIRARSWSPELTWRTGDFQVNHSIQVDSQVEAKVAILNDGNFVVTWQDHSPWGDGSGTAVLAKILSPTGSWITGEFRVNDITENSQHQAFPVATSDGGFMVVYSSPNAMGANDVYVRRFDASGNPRGASIKPTTDQPLGRWAPAVAIAPDGRYLVAWHSNEQGPATDVFAQLMSADDRPIGGEFRVNTYSIGHQNSADVAVDVSGDFVVTWQSADQDGSYYGVYAQRIDADGYAIGSEFRVNAHTNDAQWGASVDFGAPGELVFSWKSDGQFSGYSGAVMRTFELVDFNVPHVVNAGGPYRVAEDSVLILRGTVEGRPMSSVSYTWDLDGDGVFGETGSDATRGDEVTATPTYRSPSIASDRVELIRLRVTDSAGFVVESEASVSVMNTWNLDTPIPLSDEFRASQAVWPNTRVAWETTKIDANSSGRKAVTWAYDYSVGQPFPGIHARVFDSVTTPVTGDIRVQQASGIDSSASQDVAILDDGTFAVVWQRWGGDADGWGIRGRIFHPDGSPRTGEFLVNTSIQGNFQGGATVSAFGSDRFIVTWQDPNAWVDGSGNSLIGKIIGINGEVYVSDRVLNDVTAGDQWVRAARATPDGGFLLLYTSYNSGSGWNDVYVRKFASDGNATGPSTRVSPISNRHQYAAGLGVAPDGTYLVAWHVDSAETQQDVYASRFRADGTPLGGVFRVNSFLEGNQSNGDVAVDVTGEFVVSWESESQDGSLQGVYARRIDPFGAVIGSEFRVNAFTNDAQWGSSVDFGAPGELIFSWKSEGQFSGYSGAMMRTFELGNRNLPPEAIAGGPYAVIEGNAITFSAALSTDPNGDALTYSWDINGDGLFGDATGVAPSMEWPQLRALGIDGPSSVSVRVQVADGVNPPVSSPAVTLSVTNLAPTIALSGAASVDEGSPYALTLGPVLDPGLDTVSQAIVRWGDGTSTAVPGIGAVSHVYQDGRIGAGSPSSVTFTEIADADTMVNDASAFGGPGVPHGSLSTLWATNWFNPGAGGSLASYPLFKFDLTEIGLTEIQGDATFRVYLLGPESSSSYFTHPRRVDLYQVTSPWEEATVTYNTRPSASYLNSEHVVYYGNNRWVEWTVPRAVLQGWLDRPETNHGLMLVNELPDSFFFDLVFASREYGQGLTPQLVFQAAGPVRIQVDLTDEDGFYRSAGSLPVVINNVAPVASTRGPTQVVPFQPFELQLLAIDPSPVDQAAGFRFDIDWDNNGTFDQSLSQAASGTSVSSTFSTLGPRTIRIRATDKDGGWSEFQHSIQVRPFYLDGDLFIGGSDSNDTFVIRQGSVANSVSATRNGTSIGSFNTQTVRIFAGPGTDTVQVDGNGLGNIITIDPNRIVSDSMTTLGVDAELWIANGQAGDDSITIQSAVPGGTVDVDGGSGNDALISRISGNAMWDVAVPGGGLLSTGSSSYSFRAIENLNGHTGNDTFAFRDAARVTGRVVGGAGANRLDFSAYSTPVNVNLALSTATPTGGFESIQSFLGGAVSDTFVGANANSTWSIESNSLVSLNQAISIENFETLSGGTLNDEFLVRSAVTQGPRILGGVGVDSLSYVHRVDDVVIDRQLRTATALAGFDTIENFTGGTGRDTWIGLNTATSWTLTAPQVASIPGTNLLGFERLVGGNASDTFNVMASGIDTEIVAGAGSDSIIAPNVANEWIVDGLGSGRIIQGVVFAQMEALRGGTSTDRWVIESNGGGLVSIDGNAGADSLDYSNWTTPVDFQVAARSANGVQQFNSIESILGGSSVDRAFGGNTATLYTVNGPNAVLVSGVQYSGVEQWTAGAGNDVFTLSTAQAAITGFVDGGVGVDSINGFNAPTEWRLSGTQSGSSSGIASFLRMENLNGNSASDQFLVFPAATGFGAISGGSGSDTLDYASYGSGVSVGIAPAVAPGLTSYSSIESIVGSGQMDSIQGPNSATSWTLSGSDTGRVGAINFTSFENLYGGTAADAFQWTSATARLTGIAKGGLGVDQVTGFGIDNTWSLDGPNTGNLNSRFAFAEIENLIGGSAADAFQVQPLASGFGSIQGGSGSDTLSYATYGASVTVGVAPASAPGVTSYSSIESLIGSSLADTLHGPNASTVWTVSDVDAGRVGTTNFASFEHLIGGSAADTFQWTSANAALSGAVQGGLGIDQITGFAMNNTWSLNAALGGNLNNRFVFSGIENLLGGGLNDVFQMHSVSAFGTINGGSGTDTIDYTAYGSAVTVTLASNSASGIGQVIGVEAWIGSPAIDQFQGANTASTWSITGNGNGRVGTIDFSSFEEITGGSSSDVFTLASSQARVPTLKGGAGIDTLIGFSQTNDWSITELGSGAINASTSFSEIENLTGGGAEDRVSMGVNGRVLGTLNGGGGINSLSYETWTTPIQINQTSGQATNVGTLTNSSFQILIGGSGSDLINAFPSVSSVLVGNAGDDILTGSLNRDILIGGDGADTLRGQGADDVLLGGWSSFDSQPHALQQLLAEWNSTRSVVDRINNLRGNWITGTPLNQGTFLTQAPGGRTVFDEGDVDQIFGSTGSDWFIASLTDALQDRLPTEIWDELT